MGTQQEELFVGSSLFLWVCVRRMRCCLQVPVMQTPLSQAVAFPVRCRTCSSKGKHWWCCRKGHFALCPSQGSCPAAIPPPQQQPFAECCTAPGFTLSEVLSLQCSAHSCYGNKKNPMICPKNNHPKKSRRAPLFMLFCSSSGKMEECWCSL